MPCQLFHFKHLVSAVIISSLLLLAPDPVFAAFGLGNLSVVTNDDSPGQPAEIDVGFALPQNSDPIHNTDYIQIYLVNFTEVTTANLITGQFAGNPVYSVSGAKSQVTNITVLPSGYITIHNLHAINPALGQHHQVGVFITEDAEGTIIKNYAWAMATPIRGSVTVSATIERDSASLYLAGSTAPNTFIIFTEGSAVIGTDVAAPNGFFSHLFTGLQPGDHVVTFYGIDTLNRTTTPIILDLYLAAQQQLNVTDQLLSPTVSLLSNHINPDDPIQASGSAIPNGHLTIFTDAPLRTYETTASAQGLWNLSLDSSDYISGDYRLFSLVQNQLSFQSLTSLALPFTVYSGLSTGIACGDISQGDLNCDGEVDLTDFSILMFYWASGDAAADINSDGQVNLSDFSILMYYWGT